MISVCFNPFYRSDARETIEVQNMHTFIGAAQAEDVYPEVRFVPCFGHSCVLRARSNSTPSVVYKMSWSLYFLFKTILSPAFVSLFSPYCALMPWRTIPKRHRWLCRVTCTSGFIILNAWKFLKREASRYKTISVYEITQ